MGVPLVIIHFIRILPYKLTSCWGTPMAMELPRRMPMIGFAARFSRVAIHTVSFALVKALGMLNQNSAT